MSGVILREKVTKIVDIFTKGKEMSLQVCLLRKALTKNCQDDIFVSQTFPPCLIKGKMHEIFRIYF